MGRGGAYYVDDFVILNFELYWGSLFRGWGLVLSISIISTSDFKDVASFCSLYIHSVHLGMS